MNKNIYKTINEKLIKKLDKAINANMKLKLNEKINKEIHQNMAIGPVCGLCVFKCQISLFSLLFTRVLCPRI